MQWRGALLVTFGAISLLVIYLLLSIIIFTFKVISVSKRKLHSLYPDTNTCLESMWFSKQTGHSLNPNASLGAFAYLYFYLLALYNHQNVMPPSMKSGDNIYMCHSYYEQEVELSHHCYFYFLLSAPVTILIRYNET